MAAILSRGKCINDWKLLKVSSAFNTQSSPEFSVEELNDSLDTYFIKSKTEVLVLVYKHT